MLSIGDAAIHPPKKPPSLDDRRTSVDSVQNFASYEFAEGSDVKICGGQVVVNACA